MVVRAAVCRSFGEPLVIEDVTLAAPAAGEVQVDLRACAVCHSDILYAEGAWGGILPAVYGHEAAGVVTALGEGVTGVAVGDHAVVALIRSCGGCFYCGRGEEVLCEATFPLDGDGPIRDAAGASVHQGMRTGAFAERVVVHHSQVAVIPADVAFDVASLLGCGVMTGYGAVVNTAGVHPGESVVVIGTGGVGLNAIQGAAISGADRVIAIDLSDAKLASARTFGATHGVNPAREDAVAAVRALTGGRGADYVFVAVGAKPAIEQGLGLMRPGGTTVVVGMPAAGVMAEFDPGSFAGYGQTILGSKMGSSRVSVDIPALVALYRHGRLKLDQLISGRYPLEEVNEAIASVVRGEALRNVIVFGA
jgi:Zn-dependent alcohol dehydrogenase